jgi:hypothetical protein
METVCPSVHRVSIEFGAAGMLVSWANIKTNLTEIIAKQLGLTATDSCGRGNEPEQQLRYKCCSAA